jgi:hypothetical protein
VLNDLIGAVQRIRPGAAVMPFLYVPGDREAKRRLAQDLRALHPAVRHVFAWGMDDPGIYYKGRSESTAGAGEEIA